MFAAADNCDASSCSSAAAPFLSRRGARAAPALCQQEEIDARVRDRYRPAGASGALLSLGPARAPDRRREDPFALLLEAATTRAPERDAAAAVARQLPPVDPIAAVQAPWMLNAQRAPAGAYNAVVALESQLQNRGLVALQRAPQACWAPAGPLRRPPGAAPAPTPTDVIPGAAPSRATGPSPHAQWMQTHQPGDPRAFNQLAGARARA